MTEYTHQKRPPRYTADFTIENPMLRKINPQVKPYYWVSHPLVREIEKAHLVSPVRVANYVWEGQPLPEYPIKREDMPKYYQFLKDVYPHVENHIDARMRNSLWYIIRCANLDPVYPNTENEHVPDNYVTMVRQLAYLFDKKKIKSWEILEGKSRLRLATALAEEGEEIWDYWNWEYVVLRVLNCIKFLSAVQAVHSEACSFGSMPMPNNPERHLPLKKKLGDARNFDGTLSRTIKDDWHFEHIKQSLVEYMDVNAPDTIEEGDNEWIWWDVNEPDYYVDGLYGDKDSRYAFDISNVDGILEIFAKAFGNPDKHLNPNEKIDNEFNLDIYGAESYDNAGIFDGSKKVYLVYIRHEYRTQPNPGYYLVFPRDKAPTLSDDDNEEEFDTPNDLYENILKRLDGYPLLEDETFSALEWTYALEELEKTIENEVSSEAQELYAEYQMNAQDLEAHGLSDDWTALALDPRYTLSCSHIDLEECIYACAESKGWVRHVRVYDVEEQEYVELRNLEDYYTLMIINRQPGNTVIMDELLDPKTIVKSWAHPRYFNEESPETSLQTDEQDFADVLAKIHKYTTGQDGTYGEWKVRVGRIPEDLIIDHPFIVAENDTYQLVVMKS